jgi:protein-tyrosine phosphatase
MRARFLQNHPLDMEELLDLSWITPSLACGARFPLGRVVDLASELSIRRIVDLRLEEKDDEEWLGRYGLRLLHLPTEDRCAVSERSLDEGVAWVVEGLRRGERVYVHCQHGVGRSALLTLCVLAHEGYAPLAGLTLCKDSRAAISPSPAQLEAFMQYIARPTIRREAWGELPSFDELAAIAYRHLRWKAG